MQIIKPSYEIRGQIDREKILRSIEEVGRTCYKSEEHIKINSASAFVSMLVNRGHTAMIEHEGMSVRFIVDRGVSHELVRHRIASYAQESTRYCNYAKAKFQSEITVTDIKPHFEPFANGEEGYRLWQLAMEQSEDIYMRLIEIGISPQIARSVLPNSLKTEIVATMNFRQWREVFGQRTPFTAHPQIREVMIPLHKEVCGVLPEIFACCT